MLRIVEYGKDTYEFPALLALGCFDAIHTGHRELLKKAKLQAKINGLDLGVMMFRDGKGGKLVYSFEERVAFLEQFNVKFVLVIDFNDQFKKIAPIEFLQSLEEKINVKAFMSGKDFRFGAGAKGKSSTLKNYAEDEENGVWYMAVKDVDLDGEKISTTLIKSCLDGGNVAKAARLLGQPFTVSGEVVKGAGRGGAVVGFPTANIVWPEWKYSLKHGVYGVKCEIDGTEYDGIANFGPCPTFGVDSVGLEVHVENFSGDLYGKTLKVAFVDYIRDIEQFDSAEALAEQLKSDEAAVAPSPVEETVEETPVEKTPIEEPAPAVEEAPAEETPAVEEAPVEEVAPVVEEEPAPIGEVVEEAVSVEEPTQEETPAEVVVDEPASVVEEETPVEETVEEPAPVEEETSAEELAPVVEEEPIEEAPAEETPAVEEPAPIEETPVVVEESPAEEPAPVVEEELVEEPAPVVEEEPVEEPAPVEAPKEEAPAKKERKSNSNSKSKGKSRKKEQGTEENND